MYMNSKTTIKAKKDLYNNGKCFTKDRTYEINGRIIKPAGLMDSMTVNDLNEPHQIGSWWRNFKIIN